MAEDLYIFQKEELSELLERLTGLHEPLVIHEKVLLPPDSVQRLFAKIRQGEYFSHREKQALTDAGFDVSKIFPEL